ncbi:hypothetical protein EZ313_02010 [Ramlibacter henchirensis]|uniref:Uncharacterized protein n=1 Tax=Ramlibacter henchirensis TaxID=204072 RepID=A0A4Z0C2Q3_9BURK|nr:hypothetical protein [Ramlibacter henchirensis]TFZ05471.1 hypothetical protein EZ313_02010 [Ramlibacter henchirensis]
MADPVESLVTDLVESIAHAPRPYEDVIEAWGTHCPRLPVWEEALGRGLIRCTPDRMVEITEAGRVLLRNHDA